MSRAARIFAPIDVRYFEDDRILAAGDDWQLHFAAILACKGLLQNELTRRQLARIAPDSVGDIARSIDHLVEVGLFIDKGDVITIHAWSEWNDSAEDVEAMVKGGEYGNHLRWHVHGNIIKDDCSYCSDRGDSLSDSAPESKRQSRDREETDTHLPSSSPTASKPFESDFIEIYSFWRKHEDRARSLREYQTRRRDKVDHDTLVRSCRNYTEATKE